MWPAAFCVTLTGPDESRVTLAPVSTFVMVETMWPLECATKAPSRRTEVMLLGLPADSIRTAKSHVTPAGMSCGSMGIGSLIGFAGGARAPQGAGEGRGG